MKRTFFTTAATGLVALIAAPFAAEAQQGYLPEVQAEIVEGWPQADGTIVSALRISMQDGWKTYWRTPGDGGIPPRMDWKGSRNLEDLLAIWPAPSVFVDNGMTSYGYVDELLLPLVVTPKRDGRAVRLSGTLDIGVCKEICVPVRLDVSGKLTPEGVGLEASIAAAMAEQPYTSREAQVSTVSCRVSPDPDGMKVNATVAMPASGAVEHAVFEIANPELWVQEAKVTRQGSSLTISSTVMHGENEPFFLQRSDIDITILGSDYAVEIKGCNTG